MAKSAASVLFSAARVKAGSRMGREHHTEIVFAVAFSLLLQSFPLFAQETQAVGPQGALSSILSLSTTESAKALAIVRQCDAPAARILSPMLMAAARKCLDTGDLDKSVFMYECAAAVAKESMVCANLGRIVASNGEHTAALQHFSRAVELFEELDKKIGGYKSSALDNLISIGEVHYDLGDYRKALDYYGKVLLAAEERGYM